MQSSTKFALFWLSFFTIMQFYQAKERTLRKGRLVQNNSLKGKNSLVGVDFFPVHLSYTGNWSYRGFFFIWSSIEVVYEGGLYPSKVGFTSRAKRGEAARVVKVRPLLSEKDQKKSMGTLLFDVGWQLSCPLLIRHESYAEGMLEFPSRIWGQESPKNLQKIQEKISLVRNFSRQQRFFLNFLTHFFFRIVRLFPERV